MYLFSFPFLQMRLNALLRREKNDTIYSPESISLTFKKLKSSGGYEGKVSWKSFKGKLGYHTSFNHHCGQPVLSGPHVIPHG